MRLKKEGTVKKTPYLAVYAVLFSLILMLPAVEAAMPAQPTLLSPVKLPMKAPLTVTIMKPLPNMTYFQNRPFGIPLAKNGSSFIYGKITIIANVTGTNVTRVDFFVDDALKGNDTTAPYNYTWSSMLPLGLRHTITVVAYDETGNASASINVTKWRFHPLPFVVLAGLMLPALIPRTTIRGLVFNLHKNPLGYTFFAIYIHYKSVNIFKRESGTIFMKRVRVGPALSMRMLNVSPLRLARISSTFLGTFS